MAKHLWYERSHRVIHVLPNLSPRLVMALGIGSALRYLLNLTAVVMFLSV